MVPGGRRAHRGGSRWGAAGLGELVPAAVAAAVAVLFGIAVTGAFHEDGLADTADALAGGWSRERRLEILADPRHGSYGVAALCGSIVLRVVAVAALAPAAAFAGLVAAHALGRGVAVAAMGVVPLAKPDGLGAGYARRVTTSRAAAAGIVALGIAALATGWWVGPLAVAAVAAAASSRSSPGARSVGSPVTSSARSSSSPSARFSWSSRLAARGNVWWTSNGRPRVSRRAFPHETLG